MLPAYCCSYESRRSHLRRSCLRALHGLTLCMMCLAPVVLFSSCKKAPAEAAKPAAAATEAPKAAAPATAVPEPVRKLLGKWLRADGGYVLELRGAELSGVLQAAYFN